MFERFRYLALSEAVFALYKRLVRPLCKARNKKLKCLESCTADKNPCPIHGITVLLLGAAFAAGGMAIEERFEQNEEFSCAECGKCRSRPGSERRSR